MVAVEAENRDLEWVEVGLWQEADLVHSSLGGHSEGEWPAGKCCLTQHGLPSLCNLLHYSCHSTQHHHTGSVIVMLLLETVTIKNMR